MEQGLDISRRALGAVLLGGVALASQGHGPAAAAEPARIADGLVRKSPDEVGANAEALMNFFSDLEASRAEMHGIMFWRHGAVFAEGWWWPYRSELPHMLHSATKSFTASAVGMAMAEGAFKLDDKVVSFFPDELPPTLDPRYRDLTVENLLAMKTGQSMAVSGSVWRPIKTSWVTEFFKIPLGGPPGGAFLYTSASTYMLSAIISKTTGQNLHEYLKPRLFQPLGIAGESWDPGPNNISPGANGLTAKTSDLLKLGILHQQDGMWNGKRILPRGWAGQVQAPHTPGRYGWQWWLSPAGYSANGLFGQISLVLPRQQAVIAWNSATREDEIQELVESRVAAIFSDRPSRSPPLNEALTYRTKTLRAVPVARATTSPNTAVASAKPYLAEENEEGVQRVSFDFSADKCVFKMRDGRGEHRVDVGLSSWIEGRTSMTGNRLHHQYQLDDMRVAAWGCWVEPAVFEMTWQYNESAFRDTVRCRFVGTSVLIDRSVNVNSSIKSLARVTARQAS